MTKVEECCESFASSYHLGHKQPEGTYSFTWGSKHGQHLDGRDNRCEM